MLLHEGEKEDMDGIQDRVKKNNPSTEADKPILLRRKPRSNDPN